MNWTSDNWDKSSWPNFSFKEMACTHCNENNMDQQFMYILQQIRQDAGALTISSGFRCADHPIEAKKEKLGAHTFGKAADIACRGTKALAVIYAALNHGIEGIGVSQAGENRFIHLDTMNNGDDEGRFPRPTIWSY